MEDNKTNQYAFQMNVQLNPFIQKVTEKWIRPRLLDHGCDKIMPNLSQWKFEQTLNTRLEEWTKLTQHQIEDSNEKQDREIIPINGKIKLTKGQETHITNRSCV